MKRRNFLSMTSVAIATGLTANVASASSMYADISSYTTMNEFSTTTKNVLNDFTSELEFLLKDHQAKHQLIKNIQPVRIISKQSKKGIEQIIYKSKSGEFVRLRMKNEVPSIFVSNIPIYE